MPKKDRTGGYSHSRSSQSRGQRNESSDHSDVRKRTPETKSSNGEVAANSQEVAVLLKGPINVRRNDVRGNAEILRKQPGINYLLRFAEMAERNGPFMTIKPKHLGLLITFVVIVAIIAGAIAIHHGFSARDNPSGIEKVVARTARSLAVPSGAKNMKNPVLNTAENLEEARAHWADHCAFCHANNGSGESEVGRNLYPKAPDMRLPDTQKLSDGELYYTIKNGIRLTGMPAWGEPGDADADSWKLVYFIRHLPKMTPQEAEDMKKLNPQSPMEKMEEQEEEQFLEGSQSPQQSTMQHKNMQHTNKGEKK